MRDVGRHRLFLLFYAVFALFALLLRFLHCFCAFCAFSVYVLEIDAAHNARAAIVKLKRSAQKYANVEALALLCLKRGSAIGLIVNVQAIRAYNGLAVDVNVQAAEHSLCQQKSVFCA